MENEYGDMEQVAGDFCDWWAIRWWHLHLKNIEINKDLNIIYRFRTRKEAQKLFGHEKFLGRG